MLEFLSNLFSRNKQNSAETNSSTEDAPALASISYNILKDGQSTATIDISLEDYNKESIDALCKLLDILSHDNSYLETLEMVKNGLVQDGRDDVLITVFTHVSTQASKSSNRLSRGNNDKFKDQPCIKPSDMLR